VEQFLKYEEHSVKLKSYFMKEASRITPTKEKHIKQACKFNKTPANMLVGLAAATTCSALAVKFLKKGELALLMTLMALPVTLICLTKKGNSANCEY